MGNSIFIDIFLKVLNLSISASYLVIAIIIARLLLKRAPKSLYCILWLLVAIRLIFPFSIESVFSLVPRTETITTDIMYDEQPAIDTGIYSIDIPVNNYIQDNMTPQPETSANPMQIAVLVAADIWIVGIAAMLCYLVISTLRLKYKVRTAVPTEVDGTKIYQSDEVNTPFLLGLLSPKIYVPYGINDDDLKYVVLHENAHKKRRDYLIKPIAFLLLTVYWFNPIVWIAYCLLCRDIELACDERVVRGLGEDRRCAYSQALLTCAVSRKTIAACPVAFGEIGIKARVKNILNYKKPTFWIITAAAAVCIIVPICFMTQKKDAQAQENDINVSEVVNIDDSAVFKVALPAELAEQLQWISDDGIKLIFFDKSGEYEIGRMVAMDGIALQATFAKGTTPDSGEYYTIGDYGNNLEVAKIINGEGREIINHDYYVPDYSSVDIEADKESGTILIPNAAGEDTPEHLPNAGEEYKGEPVEKPNRTVGSEYGLISHTEAFSTDGVPGTDSNSETTYVIDDEASTEVTVKEDKTDYLPSEKITTIDTPDGTTNITKHEYWITSTDEQGNLTAAENGVPGTDSNSEDVYLPSEKIAAVETVEFCYLFIPQSSDTWSGELVEELTQLQTELIGILDDVTVYEIGKNNDITVSFTPSEPEEDNTSATPQQDLLEVNASLEEITKQQETIKVQISVQDEIITMLTRQRKEYEGIKNTDPNARAQYEAYSESISEAEKSKAQLEALLSQLELQRARTEEQMQGLSANIEQNIYAYFEKWAQAFCDRDGLTIASMLDNNAVTQLKDDEILEYGTDENGKEYASFGWSSPWPWGTDESAPNYHILSITDMNNVEKYVEILYYAWTSDPHVTVWREMLNFTVKNDNIVITSETLDMLDSISTASAFYKAYPAAAISGTTMDYTKNGAGEHLKGSDLMQPDTAAIKLLNILDDPKKVKTQLAYYDDLDNSAKVTFTFVEDQKSVSVKMIQPYGKNGVWIPQTDSAGEQSKQYEDIKTDEDMYSSILQNYKVTGDSKDVIYSAPVKDASISYTYGYQAYKVNQPQQFHSGIDLYAAGDHPDILAAADATVYKTGIDTSCGNYVVLLHSNGELTYYAHCERVLVKYGQNVSRGDKIATMGSTGLSTGQHLHFAVSKNGQYIEPHITENVGIVNVEALRVRENPANDANAIDILPQGYAIQILSETADFYKISYFTEDGTIEGYARKEYISKLY